MVKIAVVGYGNVGKGVIKAITTSEDMGLVGIVTKRPGIVREEVDYVPVVDDMNKLGNVDVAILCGSSEHVREEAKKIVSKYKVNTIDSFDIHLQIFDYKKELSKLCEECGTTSIISAGWDPGINSVVRVLFDYSIPFVETETKFGPGMSMGHSTAVREISGVLDAVSITIPTDKKGVHRREVYVATSEEADQSLIKETILGHEKFRSDETYVNFEPLERIRKRRLDMQHSGHIYRTNEELGQKLEYHVAMRSNPQFTGQIMVAAARASLKMPPGAYTLVEVPPIYFSEKSVEDLIRHLV